MGKLFLTLTLTVFTLLAHSQGDLTFTQKTQPYAQISGAGKVSPPDYLVSQYSFGYQLPFDFKIKDIVADRFIVSSAGEIQLLEKGKNWGPFLVPFSARMEDYFADAGVWGVLLGDTGKRMLGLDFRDLELMLETGENIINFQVWLFEEDNSIEFRYNNAENIRPGSYTNGKGPIVGIMDVEETTYVNKKSYFLTGTPQSPVFNAATLPGKSSDTVPYMLGNIPKNTVYRFAPKSASNSIQKTTAGIPGLSVYPNPTSGGDITVSFANPHAEEATISVLSIDGREVYTTTTANSTLKIPAAAMAKGIYFIKVKSGGYMGVEKVVVE